MHAADMAVSLLALLAADGISVFDCVYKRGGGDGSTCNAYWRDYRGEWQLEDRSNTTVSMDTGCLHLLANLGLDDVPPESIKQRDHCRMQLLHDLVLGSPHVPIISHLAYTQRANVNLCLLAWMVSTTFMCDDVPFGMTQSVRDTCCILDRASSQSCPESNATVAICSASRAILLQNCREFSSRHFLEVSDASRDHCRRYTSRKDVQETQRLLTYKHSLNAAVLKYKNFSTGRFKTLEVSLISIDVLFRILTAGIYMYLPHLRNLPGKILLSFQITGIIQILCAEVLYRMSGIPDLSTMVLVDTSLTLLGCMWLNSFCYQMYAFLRDLRLPNDLTPAEANKIFRCQVLYILIPWSIVCITSIALENTSLYYLFHSRIIFIVVISISIAFNMVCFGMVWYMFIETQYYMRQLGIPRSDKLASKKQIFFLSANTVMLSGVGTIVRIGLHQTRGIAQFVHCVHLATMVQGPLLFVFLICSDTTYPELKKRILAWWIPKKVSTE